MKKGQVYEGLVEKIAFPNKGIVTIDGEKVAVKNTIPGQKVEFRISKKRKSKIEGTLLSVLEKAPNEVLSVCPHFDLCGGCTYQNLTYTDQLALKAEQVKELLEAVVPGPLPFEGIKASPVQFEYRNKMEFSFGDEYKDGPLSLGMHKRNSFYDIVTVEQCQIIDSDYRMILTCVLDYFRSLGLGFYHKMTHTGFLRHLLVRKGAKTGEILIDLVTSSDTTVDLSPLVLDLRGLELDGLIVGILHTTNDSLADVIRNDCTELLYGKDYFYEELLGLTFKISPFSFFQTNSLGAEVLYQTARDFIGDTKDKVLFDLYSGTGTIAQILAPVSAKVIGVEIVEEAVAAATENAKMNQLDNCEFLAGDVLTVIDSITDKPDYIILDPPRDGIHPKALEKIIHYGVERIVYISCKPTSLARDLVVFQENGYQVERCCAVDMFPGTVHVESVVLMSRK